MKVIDIINSSKPFPSLEIVPPLKGSDINKLYNAITPLMEFNPPFINVTCHREEIVYSNSGNRTIITKRPSTVAIAAAVMKRFPVEVVPHVICSGTDKYHIENELLDLNFLDIHNVMALRGDAAKGLPEYIPEPDGYLHTDALVRQISDLNKGIYLDDTLKETVPTDFSIGVAGYPEKHYEAQSLDEDILHLKYKIDQGADYVITQMFFDNDRFYRFVEKCRAVGIDVPIIPGIKPISLLSHISKLPETFSITLPDSLKIELAKCKTNEQVYQTGIEWASNQCKELLAYGVPAIHFYTMGKAENVINVLRNVF